MRSLTLPWAPEPEETPSAPLLPAPLHLVLPPPGPLSLSMCVRVFTCPRHVTSWWFDRPHLSARGLSMPTALVHAPPLACPLDLVPSLLLK